MERAILHWDAPELEETGGLQAALRRIVEWKKLRRMPRRQAAIDGIAAWRSKRLPGGGL